MTDNLRDIGIKVMKLIENVFGDTEEETNQRNAFVDSAKQITWERFQKAINIKISKMKKRLYK